MCLGNQALSPGLLSAVPRQALLPEQQRVTLTVTPHLALPLPAHHDLLGMLLEPGQRHQPQNQKPQQPTLLLTKCEHYPWQAGKCQKPLQMFDQTPERCYCQAPDANKATHIVLWCLAGSGARHLHVSSRAAGLHDSLSPATPLLACAGSELQYWLSLFPGWGQCYPAAPAGHHLSCLFINKEILLHPHGVVPLCIYGKRANKTGVLEHNA